MPVDDPDLDRDDDVLGTLAQALARPPADPQLRQRVLELAEAPAMPVDLSAYAWEEPIPGVKMVTLREDPDAGIRKVLVWAQPGARVPPHRHLGEEDILVMQGRLRDHRDVYGIGQICHSRTGFVHSEEVLLGENGEDCICFVVYYGGHESVDEVPGT